MHQRLLSGSYARAAGTPSRRILVRLGVGETPWKKLLPEPNLDRGAGAGQLKKMKKDVPGCWNSMCKGTGVRGSLV